MAKMIFVNLPVADLVRSIAFYEAVGAVRNPQFSDETAACMVFSETIHVMLLTHDKYRQFTDKEIADPHRVSAALISLSAEDRAEVDDTVDRAIAAGGRRAQEPVDHGFMYESAFEDPDGHGWGLFWMDMAAAEKAMAASAA